MRTARIRNPVRKQPRSRRVVDDDQDIFDDPFSERECPDLGHPLDNHLRRDADDHDYS